MARKRSRRARKRERERKRQTRVRPQDLLGLGRQKLEAGNAREALDLLRQARHKDEGLEGLDLLFLEAYALRAGQLKAKGMEREAEVMRGLAEAHRASIDPSALNGSDFARYLRGLDLPDAVRGYADALPVRGGLPGVERELADRLVAVRCWEALSALEAGHPLRQDAAHVREAIPAMDGGAWAEAGAALARISRRSPFAPWRIFCRAMACFCAEDDEGLRRAVSLLPEDFALSGVVAEWKRALDPAEEEDGAVGADGVYALFWEGGGVSEGLGRKLVDAVRAGRFPEVERLIPPLSRALYPEDPEAACATLLQTLGIAARSEEMPLHNVLRLAKRLLPPEVARFVGAKIGLVTHRPSHDEWRVAPAMDCLSLVGCEFTDARRQALARGRVLEFLARSGHAGGACPYCVGPRTMDVVWGLIGERSEDASMVFADLMLASLKADPENRNGYSFLLGLLRGRRSAKPKVEQALIEMTNRFPEDAAPCLELATLYYSKNAYRKAEAVLEEAQRRAPHDEQVLDRHAIGYLKSADQNRNRGKRHLAERDYERAEALGRRRVAPVLTVKRLGMEVIDAGADASGEVERRLEGLPPVEQLRSLAVLIHDLEGVQRVEAGALKGLKGLLWRKEGLVARLTPAEAVSLMAPLEEGLELLFEDLQVAPALSSFWTPLLGRAGGEDLISLFDILLACEAEGRAAVRKEIDRRLSGARRAGRDPVLLFYLAAIRYMEGLDTGSRRFREAIDRTDEAQRKGLREAATRIAEFAHGPLQEALKRFDFSLLDSIPFLGGPPGIEEVLGNLSDLLSGEEEEDFEEEEADVFDVLEDLEEMVDAKGLRGAPMPELKEAAGQLRSDPQMRREWDRIARELEPVMEDLSREVQILLYPRRRKQRR